MRGYKGERRSGFEDRVANYLKSRGVAFDYEPYSYRYNRMVRGGSCNDCSSSNVVKSSWYTPDFVLSNGIFLEAKGKFTPTNRTSMLEVLNTCTDINRDNFRVLFMSNNLFGKKGKRYGDWCAAHGIIYAVSHTGEVPEDWIL